MRLGALRKFPILDGLFHQYDNFKIPGFLQNILFAIAYSLILVRYTEMESKASFMDSKKKYCEIFKDYFGNN